MSQSLVTWVWCKVWTSDKTPTADEWRKMYEALRNIVAAWEAQMNNSACLQRWCRSKQVESLVLLDFPVNEATRVVRRHVVALVYIKPSVGDCLCLEHFAVDTNSSSNVFFDIAWSNLCSRTVHALSRPPPALIRVSLWPLRNK